MKDIKHYLNQFNEELKYDSNGRPIVNKHSNEKSIAHKFNISLPIASAIMSGMIKGWIGVYNDKGLVKYGISKENIYDVVELPHEQIDRIIQHLEKDGFEFAYEKDEDFAKTSLVNPLI